ncbi:hypothetical protein G6F46_015431 [Rhizopus delemar]|nr:hypothetical protein G6F46_015431 [Rhizopus delemar]
MPPTAFDTASPPLSKSPNSGWPVVALRTSLIGARSPGRWVLLAETRFRPVATTVTRTSSCLSGSSTVPTTTVAS